MLQLASSDGLAIILLVEGGYSLHIVCIIMGALRKNVWIGVFLGYFDVWIWYIYIRIIRL